MRQMKAVIETATQQDAIEILADLLRLARQDKLELLAVIAEDQGFRDDAERLRKERDKLQEEALFPTVLPAAVAIPEPGDFGQGS